jgi:hypothetical protein
MALYSHISTGWDSLDEIIDNLRPGDNVVWQVDTIEQYRDLVTPFVDSALAGGERVVYLRFASHPPLMDERPGISVHELDLEGGFEQFSTRVHTIVSEEGAGAFVVFDSLSDLLQAWATDSMTVNFFFITCPYLYELQSIAYFAILRKRHSFTAIARIREITQVLIDVHSLDGGKMCVHPIKVLDRYSPTMFFPHVREGDRLVPVIDSVDAAQLFNRLSTSVSTTSQRRLDYWDRLFMEAQALLSSGTGEGEKLDMVVQLSRIMLTREPRFLEMIRRHMGLDDLLGIKERVVGTGFVGGKSLGMLLARKIISRGLPREWVQAIEPHDSFYVGSDVFYSYIVQNGWWKLFMEHKTPEGYFVKGFELREKLLNGRFSRDLREQFQLLLEYFGQSPIIVRSSSLLEDAFGSAFAGKYDSFFCVNQGSPEQRVQQFEQAVRKVFASTMSGDALAYRMQRGLDLKDEQMALLVQRVSGTRQRNFFFPCIAGVGLSNNPYVWKKDLEPGAGMLRLVMGLGTRAVGRGENDYTRIVHLDDPMVRPSIALEDLRRYSQHRVDVLDLELNTLRTITLREVAALGGEVRMGRLGTRDPETPDERWILTLDPVLEDSPVVPVVSEVLKVLQDAYGFPVDIELTINFGQGDEARLNILQCRPIRNPGPGSLVEMPRSVDPESVVIRTQGDFMGGNVSLPIECVVWVEPEAYLGLTPSGKYSVARLVGRLNATLANRLARPTLLIGPGRWGTEVPSMGVPVSFSEINNISALAEVSYRDGTLMPELSFGSHFFHDLLETGIFYIAVHPERQGEVFNAQWLKSRPNALGRLLPREGEFGKAVKVIMDASLLIRSNVATQEMICTLA